MKRTVSAEGGGEEYELRLKMADGDDGRNATRVGVRLTLVHAETLRLEDEVARDRIYDDGDFAIAEVRENGDTIALIVAPLDEEARAAFDSDVLPLLEKGSEIYHNIDGIQLTAFAFNRIIPGFGTWFLPFAAFFFAFSTIVSWGFYGETCAYYLFGQRAVIPFKLLYVSMILVGAAITQLKPVLDFSDAMLGLMLLPNLAGTLMLAPRVMAAARDYFARLASGGFDEEARRATEARQRLKNG